MILTEREKELIQTSLNSNRLSYGPMSREFEQKFSDLHGCANGIFCNSGTSALHLAFAALRELGNWDDGDEVIVPATTYVASANAVLHSGLRPVLVDVKPDTFNIDPERIEERISPRTRSILPVHLLGLPADMEPILAIAEKHQLKTVEDSCESMLATYKDKPVGSMGDVGCFSTYVAHLITTGVGGLAITSNPALAEIMRSLMHHGRDSHYISIDDDKGLSEEDLWEVVQNRYRFNRIGFSYRMTEMEAALGLGQLEHADEMVERRAEIASYYREALAPFEDRIQVQASPPDRTHANMVFGCVCSQPGEAQRLTMYLETRNIETRPLFPLITQSIADNYDAAGIPMPVAEWLSRNGFYIGCHPYLTDAEVEYTVETIRGYFQENKTVA